jgi:hypothetical protein
LTDQSIEVGVGRTFDVEAASADVVDGLIVDHEGTVGMLQGGVGRQDRVVRFHHGGRHLGCGVDGEFEFRFLSEVDRKSFHQEGGESGSGASSERVEDQEALKAGALFGLFANTF